MSFGIELSILKCGKCGNEYEGDVSDLASPTPCPNCGKLNGREQSTHKDKDGWETI